MRKSSSKCCFNDLPGWIIDTWHLKCVSQCVGNCNWWELKCIQGQRFMAECLYGLVILLGCCSESGDQRRLSLHTRNTLEILAKDVVERNDEHTHTHRDRRCQPLLKFKSLFFRLNALSCDRNQGRDNRSAIDQPQSILLFLCSLSTIHWWFTAFSTTGWLHGVTAMCKCLSTASYVFSILPF